MLQRVLEPEVMDTARDAADYNSMDHAEVNRRFIHDFIGYPLYHDFRRVLDLGTGTALIPIELCRALYADVTAVDMSAHMLRLARDNVRSTGFDERIRLERADAKRLPHRDRTFAAVISNSIVHHIPDPSRVLAEAVRVTADFGFVFFRDLLRPADDAEVDRLVQAYAGGASPRQRQLFKDSLRAALTLAEVQELVVRLGFRAETVKQTSDRHWTWATRVARTKL